MNRAERRMGRKRRKTGYKDVKKQKGYKDVKKQKGYNFTTTQKKTFLDAKISRIEAAQQADTKAILTSTMACVLLAVRDVYGFGPARAKKIMQHVRGLFKYVAAGEINFDDVIDTVQDEMDINLNDWVEARL